MNTKLSKYNNDWYDPKAGALKRLLWYFTGYFILNTGLFPISKIKVLILRLFGAEIGKQVNIKPNINIKYPWLLTIGNNVWIGENVWIDNLVPVRIDSNVCISQGAMLLTGNHNYKRSTFDLMVNEIVLEEGVWIGARSTVCPGVTCHSHSVLTVGSVATNDTEAYSIYSGNPAVNIKKREIEN